ncbi:uncharacterized protein ALTATR162_LOCUS155 [Alternaria atra]|uniref:Uncharacterized protein n=1 Tax=Alternaria atra TaxID=119953 RepID=A0A8J2HQY4_9PLEO|nr:uncharacterized protein ALTATR162_LOCUS155 [Alternaria atra]CAG5137573.1 unnamed protein product [Alternaria atra]
MLFGVGSSKMHTGRRVQLVVWLQIMQEWVGIAGVTVYAPTVFGLAGLSPVMRQRIAGLNSVFNMFSTLICVFTLDRIGRCWTCYWSSVGQGIALTLTGAFSYLGEQATLDGDASKGLKLRERSRVHAEIFPLEVRAKGNAWGVMGWSIGNDRLTLLCPVMFESIGEETLYIFAACNAISMPMVCALHPETNQRTLEEIDLLFALDSTWNWEVGKNFARLRDQTLGQEATADSKANVEQGASRKQSLVRRMYLRVEAVNC